jgi:hypothetical protein
MEMVIQMSKEEYDELINKQLEPTTFLKAKCKDYKSKILTLEEELKELKGYKELRKLEVERLSKVSNTNIEEGLLEVHRLIKEEKLTKAKAYEEVSKTLNLKPYKVGKLYREKFKGE